MDNKLVNIETHNKIINTYKDAFTKVGNIMVELKDENIYLKEQNNGLKNHVSSSSSKIVDDTKLVSNASMDSDKFTNSFLKSIGYTDERITKTREKAQKDLKIFLEKK
jgi:hypothetical protein